MRRLFETANETYLAFLDSCFVFDFVTDLAIKQVLLPLKNCSILEPRDMSGSLRHMNSLGV